jgi:hypothetical protein
MNAPIRSSRRGRTAVRLLLGCAFALGLACSASAQAPAAVEQEPVAGRFGGHDAEAGLIRVDGRVYRLVGPAVQGFERRGRPQPWAQLERGSPLVLHPVAAAADGATPAVRRVELFEPLQ